MLRLAAIILLSLGVGVLGLLYYQELKNNRSSVQSQLIVREPRMVSELIVIHSDADGMAIAIRNGTTPPGVAAAAMMQWTSRTAIGVDFTGFDWSTIDGIGEQIPDNGTIQLSGTIPPLEVLHNYSVDGSESKRIISRLLAFNEEAELYPRLEGQRAELTKCLGAQAILRADTIDLAKSSIMTLISAAVPPLPSGEPTLEFNIKFENEDQLLATEQDPERCDRVTVLD